MPAHLCINFGIPLGNVALRDVVVQCDLVAGVSLTNELEFVAVYHLAWLS
jgi:hypothetical protein